jgi:hypothetical protein
VLNHHITDPLVHRHNSERHGRQRSLDRIIATSLTTES